jgi:putative colanic acid biosynthesis acetyltransferase WcaF
LLGRSCLPEEPAAQSIAKYFPRTLSLYRGLQISHRIAFGPIVLTFLRAVVRTRHDDQFPGGLRGLPREQRSGLKQAALPDQVARVLWSAASLLLFRLSPRRLDRWRAGVLRLFGAHIGRECRISNTARIWAPWNLICEDFVEIDDEVEIYNPAAAWLGARCRISRGAFLCGATLDYARAEMQPVLAPIAVGRYAWIAARACVMMGVSVGNGAVLGLGSIATRDLEGWVVYAGAPARPVRPRPRVDLSDPQADSAMRNVDA